MFFLGSRYQVCVTADAGPGAGCAAAVPLRVSRDGAQRAAEGVARAHGIAATNFNGVLTWSKCFTLLG